MSQPVSEISLSERIGGEPAVNAAVDRFYERALADPELKDFFNGVSMSRLKAQQFAFLSQALGGPKQYSGASMRDAHSKLPTFVRSQHAIRICRVCLPLESRPKRNQMITDWADLFTGLLNQVSVTK